MFINSYLSKNNTIIKNSRVNMGKNPIVEMFYGGEAKKFSRFIFRIDLENLKHQKNVNGYFGNTDTVKHYLRMTNTSFLNYNLNKNSFLGKDRATSFVLNLYHIRQDFAEGYGYDMHKTGFTVGENIYDEQPSNYFSPFNNEEWSSGSGALPRSINPIARQVFYDGSENLCMDITRYVNDILNGNVDEGTLVLAFDKELENSVTDTTKYVGFFSRHAKTIYSPFVQSIDYNTIQDDRYNFVTNRNNRLYYYYKRNGVLTDPQTMPQVHILNDEDDIIEKSYDEGNLRVIRQKKGVYYIEFILSDTENECVAYSDVWEFPAEASMPTSELSFTTKKEKPYEYGDFTGSQPRELTFLSKGLNKGSIINQGGQINVFVLPKIKYSYGQYDSDVKVFYSLYVREGNKDINVINNGDTYYQESDNIFYSNILKTDTFTDGSKHFVIDSKSLTPNRYYIDLYVYQDGTEKILKEFLYFDVK